MGDEEHNFKPLKIKKGGKKVQACQECGALKIGEDTIVVNEDHIELSPLTSDPPLAEGRVWFRSDNDEKRWSPDGTKVEIFSTASAGGPNLTSIKGFVYNADTAPKTPITFTADPNFAVWIKQHAHQSCIGVPNSFNSKYEHWSGEDNKVDVPLPSGGTKSVYGYETMSVHQVPDGTLIDDFGIAPTASGGCEGIAWDGEYIWVGGPTGEPTGQTYKFLPDGTLKDTAPFRRADICFDGIYFWGVSTAGDTVYQIKPSDGSEPRSWPVQSMSPQGITWDGEYIYTQERGGSNTNAFIYQYLPDGTLKQSSGLIGQGTFRAENLSNDGIYLYATGILGAAANDPGGYVYRLKKSDFSFVDKFTPRGGVPTGSCWDGKYHISTDENSNWLYKYSNADEFDLSYEVSW